MLETEKGSVPTIVKKNIWMDYLIMGEIVMIGLAEAVHLAAMLFDWTFQRCTMWFLGLVGIVCVLLAGVLVFKCRGAAKGGKGQDVRENRMFFLHGDRAEWILYTVFILLFFSQLLFIWMGQEPYVKGDMTVETVESFLEADHIYQWNPMTGQPYVEGIPSRLKILCLPTLYGSLCKIFDLNPEFLVWTIVPTATLLSAYAAFYILACSLFPVMDSAATVTDNVRSNTAHTTNVGKKRMCFLIVVSLLLWVGTYFHTMDGFGLLYCGWRGTAIRNGILLPWLMALCLRRKWMLAALCVLAEACMVWTFYGMGVCMVVTVGMAVAERCTQERPRTLSDSFWEADSEECTK